MATLLPRANLNDQVYETLRQCILTRDPGPGAKLSLHELAAELGVSRSPVHHALTRLVSEGLLSVKARRGYYVTPVNAHALVDSVVKAKPSAAKGKYLKSVTVSSTMGPGVSIDTAHIDERQKV